MGGYILENARDEFSNSLIEKFRKWANFVRNIVISVSRPHPFARNISFPFLLVLYVFCSYPLRLLSRRSHVSLYLPPALRYSLVTLSPRESFNIVVLLRLKTTFWYKCTFYIRLCSTYSILVQHPRPGLGISQDYKFQRISNPFSRAGNGEGNRSLWHAGRCLPLGRSV